MACVSDGRVYISRGCVGCRIVAEARLIGVIDDMTPAQLAFFQHAAAVPQDPALTTPSAWARAIEAHRSRGL